MPIESGKWKMILGDTELKENLISKGASLIGYADLADIEAEARQGFD